MNRRDFLRRAAIVASGAIAVDQLELLDRLGWVRRLFTTGGWSATPAGIVVTRAQWDDLLREDYVMRGIVDTISRETPFKARFNRRLLTPREVIREFSWDVDCG